MKLSEIPKEELELMGYDDIAAVILQESGKKMKLQDIFKKVCKALNLPDSIVEDQLMDFFELMSIKNGYWDLQTRHKLDIVIEDEEDEEEENIVESEEEIVENPDSEDIFYDKDDETDDVDDDDLADLVVIDSEDENAL